MKGLINKGEGEGIGRTEGFVWCGGEETEILMRTIHRRDKERNMKKLREI